VEKGLEARRIQYRGLKLAPDNAMNRFRIEEIKGVLFLDSLRRKLGDDQFFSLLAHPGSPKTHQDGKRAEFPRQSRRPV
jgi:hypothetical protein